MSKQYKLKEQVSQDLVTQLLHNRGIKSEEEKERFLNPDFSTHLHDPFLLPNMGKAVDRVLSAIEKGEKIGIWSDYDADGIPGGAMLYNFFKLLDFHNFINYIPDRHDEGYGLNIEGMEKFKNEGVKLIITVDCGTRDHGEIEYAQNSGMDVIVTDHHEPGEELPKAFAIVNHKLKESVYPESVLCGSGIAWKLVEGILLKNRTFSKDGKPFELAQGKEKWLLDLVGLATLSDMVPLTGENRVLASFGLKVLRQTKRHGLKKLCQILKINKENITEDDIGFLITPRINAASRMGRPMDAFDLLTSEMEEEAIAKAEHLDKINQERKVLVAKMTKEALKIIRAKIENHGDRPLLVAGSPEWRPALLGLVANSIAEEYGKPVFLWGKDNGDGYKGSCRSDGETDLVALMENSREHFLEFGGHKFSGGFSVDFEKIHDLEEVLLGAFTGNSKEEKIYWGDSELKVKDINMETALALNKLAPFGIGNEKPVFFLSNVIPEKIERFGKEKNHLSLNVRDGSRVARAISFFTEPDKFGDNLKEGVPTNLVANLELSYFMNRPEVRLRVINFFK